MAKENIQDLMINYVKNNITEEIKGEFLSAVIHFTLNEKMYNKYDITRIKYKLEKISETETVEYIKLYSTYVYIIFRTVAADLVDEDVKAKCCEAILKISNDLTEYLTMGIDEDDLHKDVQAIVKELGINNECSNLILKKFNGIDINF